MKKIALFLSTIAVTSVLGAATTTYATEINQNRLGVKGSEFVTKIGNISDQTDLGISCEENQSENGSRATQYPDGYRWDYGNRYTITLKFVQYSDYTHGTKQHSNTAMVNGVYTKITKNAGVVKKAETDPVSSATTYNSYYDIF